LTFYTVSLNKLYTKKKDVYMELLKKLFKEEEKVIGLCAFKKQPQKVYSYDPKFNATKLYYSTNTKNNFFLL